MAKTNDFAALWLKHLFWNDDIANVGDAAGLQNSAAAGNIYLSLHTADPGEGTTSQTTNEISYTGYARQAVARSSAAWTFTAGDPPQMANTALVQWGLMTAGAGGTATYVGFGSAVSGAGYLYCRVQITSPGSGLVVSNGINPEAAALAIVYKED